MSSNHPQGTVGTHNEYYYCRIFFIFGLKLINKFELSQRIVNDLKYNLGPSIRFILRSPPKKKVNTFKSAKHLYSETMVYYIRKYVRIFVSV